MPTPNKPTVDETPVAPPADIDIYELAQRDPAKARQILELEELLEAKKKRNLQQSQTKEFQMMQLRNFEAEIEKERQTQLACARNGHRRENGSIAISGQNDSQHTLRTVCLRCGQLYVGVGTEPGQLPHPLFAQISQENIGG